MSKESLKKEWRDKILKAASERQGFLVFPEEVRKYIKHIVTQAKAMPEYKAREHKFSLVDSNGLSWLVKWDSYEIGKKDYQLYLMYRRQPIYVRTTFPLYEESK